MLQTNNNNTVKIKSEDGHFKQAQMSIILIRCLFTWFQEYMVVLLFVDNTYLLVKYKEILLAVTMKDVNNGLFHVAFTIIDNRQITTRYSLWVY